MIHMKIENNPPNELSNYRLLSKQALRLALAALRRKQIIIKINQIEYPIEVPADDRVGPYILSKPAFPKEFSNLQTFAY